MSRRQIAEHTWYNDCPICGRRVTARTTIGLAELERVHLVDCRAKAIKALEERKAELAQGDLFAPPGKRSSAP
jgi:hypothetical protein